MTVAGGTGAEEGGARRLPAGRLLVPLLRLARPSQWTKSAFVMVGPFYGLRDLTAKAGVMPRDVIVAALIAAAVFGLASSACYVVNDVLDREADRLHPRKRHRPIASGRIGVGTALAFAAGLIAMAAAGIFLLPAQAPSGVAHAVQPRLWVAGAVLIYALNVTAYSARIKHIVIADVMSLSLGFVLRVMAGCWAVGITPTVWLLNVTLFLAMFLSFGKRLGERRTLAIAEADEPGARAAAHRPVQGFYTDTLLQMAVVVTAVATLMGYAAYVQAQARADAKGFDPLWLTTLPATYCLLRAIVLLERGTHDDPTELAGKDRAFQIGALLFAAITAAVMFGVRG